MAMTVLQTGFPGTAPPPWLRRALDDGLGGVLLFARNIAGPEQTAGLVAGLRAANPELIVAIDEEGGAVTRLEAATGSSWPGNLALGVVDDPALTERVAREIGRMVAAAGITLDYAPVADVNTDPDNPVIGVRSFGSDPELVARHAAAFVRGVQDAGVAACAKHFPGHGDTVTDSHLALPTVRAPLPVLRRRELPPFRAAIRAGVRAIMCGHLLVPGIDTVPATLSRRVITDLLRGELGFGGLVVTDAIEMRAVAERYGPGEIAVRALAAGADLICLGLAGHGADLYALRDAIVAAVRDGRLPEERLAEAAARVRGLAAWCAAQAPRRRAAAGEVDHGLGLAAATAALRASGAPDRPVLRSAPLVIEMAAEQTRAVGRPTPLGLGRALAEILPGTERAEVTEGDPLPALPRTRPVVLTVRDAHRHPWMRRLLAEAVRERPDAVVVETGVPGPPIGALYLATHGDSTASARAAARWLTAPAEARVAGSSDRP